jgi:hypothetical protein
VRNSVQPGAHTRVATKTRQGTPDGEEDLLREILSVGRVVGMRGTQPTDRAPICLHQIGELTLVVGFGRLKTDSLASRAISNKMAGPPVSCHHVATARGSIGALTAEVVQ